MPPPSHIGRYHILGVLGQGAMGVVYRGRDEGLDRDVAVKVMKGDTMDDTRARFLREARAAAKLQHPHIVTVYELGEHEGAPFLAMELLEGQDLHGMMRADDLRDPRRSVPIMIQTLEGLGHAHARGIVHRDVKPSNIYLVEGRHVKLLDFGIARFGESLFTMTGMVMGTPHYMSPEQVRSEPVDGRSDLFSAGLILFELLVGEKVYRPGSVMSVLYQIANEDADLSRLPSASEWRPLRAVLERALTRDREHRYAHARAMADSLAAALRAFPEQESSATEHASAATLVGPTPFLRGATVPAPEPATQPALASVTVRPAPAWSNSVPTVPVPAVRGPVPDVLPELLPPDRPTRPSSTRTVPIIAMAGPSPSSRAPMIVAFVVLAIVGAAGGWWWLGRPPAAPGVTPEPPTTMAAAPSITPATTPATVPVLVTPSAVPTPEPTPAADPAPPTPLATAPPPPSLRPTPPAAPIDVAAHLERANAHYEAGRLNSALAEARTVLRADAANAEALALIEDVQVDLAAETSLKKARAAMSRGDLDAALAAVHEGLRVKENDSRLRALLRELSN